MEKIKIKNIADARKDTIKKDSAWHFLESFEKIYAGKGKKVLEFSSIKENKKEILKICLGRTGNLRAPSVRKNKTLYVGYNENIYELLKDI